MTWIPKYHDDHQVVFHNPENNHFFLAVRWRSYYWIEVLSPSRVFDGGVGPSGFFKRLVGGFLTHCECRQYKAEMIPEPLTDTEWEALVANPTPYFVKLML